jgi:hypothetical protein
MAEEATVVPAGTETVENTTEIKPNLKNPFDDTNWSDEPVIVAAKEEKTEEKSAEAKTIPTQTEEEILDEDGFVKEKLGFESFEAAKREIEELKKLKDSHVTFKYENEESEKLHKAITKGDRKEVFKILEKQEKLERLTSGELNINNAAEVIKAAMQFKYKELTPDEIEYRFNKQFSVPLKPAQKEEELEEEYAERLSAWEQAKKEVETEMMIEAKLARPELEKLKANLVLPEIPGEQNATQKQPSKEDLDAAKRYNDAYLQSVDSSIKEFNGFSVSVKHEDMDLSVMYGVAQEDKAAIEKELKDFVQSNYDANALFAERWVNADGTLNTKQIAEDRFLLAHRDKIFQKIAMDAASKRLETHLKTKKNINIDETKTNRTAEIGDAAKTESEKMAEFFWNQS